MDLKTISALADLMLQKGIEYLDVTEGGNRYHLALRDAKPEHAALGSGPMTEAPETQPLDVDCPCGHPLEIEHSDAGCLRGCDAKVCARRPEAK